MYTMHNKVLYAFSLRLLDNNCLFINKNIWFWVLKKLFDEYPQLTFVWENKTDFYQSTSPRVTVIVFFWGGEGGGEMFPKMF